MSCIRTVTVVGFVVASFGTFTGQQTAVPAWRFASTEQSAVPAQTSRSKLESLSEMSSWNWYERPSSQSAKLMSLSGRPLGYGFSFALSAFAPFGSRRRTVPVMPFTDAVACA